MYPALSFPVAVSRGKEATMNQGLKKLLQTLVTLGSVAGFLLWLNKRV